VTSVIVDRRIGMILSNSAASQDSPAVRDWLFRYHDHDRVV